MNEQDTSAFWFARAAYYTAQAAACDKQSEIWSQHRRDAYQCERRARDIMALYNR